MPAFCAFASGILGWLLLLVATFLPWFRVPESRMVNGVVTIAGVEPGITAVWKVMCLLVIVVAFRVPPIKRVRLLTLWFVALLFFPYFTMVWSPRVAAQASWLQIQHESLSWLGGDIYGEQEIKEVEFKHRVEIADAELQTAPIQLPDWTPQTMEWSRLPEIVGWLGYSDAFCQFVNKGWFFALAGAALALVPLCRRRSGFDFQIAETVGRTGFAAFCAAGAVALVPIFAAGSLIAFARSATSRGDHEAACRWLDQATFCLPVIRQDPSWLAQRGALESALGLTTPAAALRHAILLDKQGFTTGAQDEFTALLAIAPPGSVLHRETERGLLRFAIRALGNGQPEIAAEMLEGVLDHDPCNVKALYALQLACLRTSQFERLSPLVARTDEVYRFFNTNTKAPVIAAAYENGALAEYLRGHTDDALALRRVSLGRPR